ncbi:PREDICTED: cationic amino acid transporter 2-like, partial [Acropora digitifera]|uniref:cationic amino acid transporter 2-like n=1 Tax=Acropora digitifera TaxID=70779 RepID=UPI00077A64FE
KNGPSIVISILIAGIASALSGLCYAESSARVPKASSAYVYSYVTIGEFCAFVIVIESYCGILHRGILISKSLQLVITSWFMPLISCINVLVILFAVSVGACYAELKNWTENFMPYGFSGVMIGAATRWSHFQNFGLDFFDISYMVTMNAGKMEVGISLTICLQPTPQFFRSLAKVNPRSEIPTIATVVSGVPSALFAFIFNLHDLVEMMSIGTLLVYAIVAGCMMVLGYRPETSAFVRQNDLELLAVIIFYLIGCTLLLLWLPQNKTPLPFMVPFVPVLPLVSVFINVFLMLKLSYLTWLRFAVWMVIGKSTIRCTWYYTMGLSHWGSS